jgi:hypothetical protein
MQATSSIMFSSGTACNITVVVMVYGHETSSPLKHQLLFTTDGKLDDARPGWVLYLGNFLGIMAHPSLGPCSNSHESRITPELNKEINKI